SEREITQAIHCACLEEVVARVPGGLDYKLGQFGAGISGGEKQRLALARVVIQGRPILVLDEATSALDADTKAPLLTRLAAFTADKLVLVISHDRAIRTWAGRRIVIRDGESLESRNELPSAERLDVPFNAEIVSDLA